MAMSPQFWLVPFFAGLVLGSLFFAGLWWTVQRAPHVRNPMALIVASFLVRTGILLAGFLLVMDERWERLVACLIGYVAARLLLMRFWGTERRIGDSRAGARGS